MAPAEQLRKDPRPWVVATAFSHRLQRAQVEQAEALGLLERTLEATARFDGREIPQGPGDRCHGDTAPLGTVIGMERLPPVHDDAGTRAGAAAWHRHIHEAPGARVQLPERARGLMAGKRRRSARERGRQVAPERGHASVADREDTLVHAVQPAHAQPVADRRRSVSKRVELLTRYDAMLGCHERGQSQSLRP